MTVNCVFDTALPLAPSVAALIYKTAQTMAREKKTKMKFGVKKCKGVLTTEWKQDHVGAVHGVRFEAKIRIGRHTDTTVLVVRSFRGRIARWTEHPDLDDLNRHTVAGAAREGAEAGSAPH